MKKRLLLSLLLLATFSYAQEKNEITVYKSPYCECCKEWVKIMETNGFKVNTIMKNDLTDIKMKNGVTANISSCHTALIGNYVIEGHVDASAVKKLLKDKPKDIKILTVPGMVIGSPGMTGDKKESYNVLAIKNDGSSVIYEKH